MGHKLRLNKGESLHTLRRDRHYANQGSIRRRQLEQQTEQAWCLTVLTNAVITWTILNAYPAKPSGNDRS